MAMKIITWNINSVRLRLQAVLRLLEDERPDVLCLQETKCPDEHFPAAAFAEAGYPHQAIRGEKGYNGLAILARETLTAISHHDWCGKGDCRHLSARLANSVLLHNFYVPAGGDVPDPAANEKFAHKLAFLDEMEKHGSQLADGPAILVGDLNIAPREDDVFSHRQLINVVSHTPAEVAALQRVMAAGAWQDAVRHLLPEGKLYSWWSYRARDWEASDRGRRLDHIWVTPPLLEKLQAAAVLKQVRGWTQPSDHAPVQIMLS